MTRTTTAVALASLLTGLWITTPALASTATGDNNAMAGNRLTGLQLASSDSTKSKYDHDRAKREHRRCLVILEGSTEASVIASYQDLVEQMQQQGIDADSSGKYYCASDDYAEDVARDLANADYIHIDYGGNYQTLHQQSDSSEP